MRSALLFAIVVCLLATSAVFAQVTPSGALWTPRSTAMGSTGIGVADDAAAWFQNPAGLAALRPQCKSEENLWAAEATGGYGQILGEKAGVFTVSGWQPAHLVGMGFGYGDVNDTGRAWGIGFGMNYRQSPFSYGFNFVRDDPVLTDPETAVNAGFMFRFVQPDKDPLRLGLYIRDLTDVYGNGLMFDLGIAWPVTNELLFAADFRDLSNEVDTQVNAGAEYWFGPDRDWAARVGINDNLVGTDFTMGLGYVFGKDVRIDAAVVDSAPDTTWNLSATYTY
jgi:hypothetical protein